MSDDLIAKIERLEQLIMNLGTPNEYLAVEEAARFLDYSVNYVYKLTHLGTLPFYRPNGKKIFFKRSELNDWIGKHKCRSIDEIQASTESNVLNSKRNK